MQIRLISALLMIGAACGLAHADNPDGARLADSCTSCHGKTGGAIPPLAGQDAEALEAQLRLLAAGDANATIMPRLLREYDDAEIEALAKYFAKVKQ